MANKIRPEEQEPPMLEIYVLKLLCCEFWRHSSLPCGECSDFQPLEPFCQKLLPWGRSLPGGQWNRPIRAQRVSWSKERRTARTAPPSEFPLPQFAPWNLTQIILPVSPNPAVNHKKAKKQNIGGRFEVEEILFGIQHFSFDADNTNKRHALDQMLAGCVCEGHRPWVRRWLPLFCPLFLLSASSFSISGQTSDRSVTQINNSVGLAFSCN